MSTAVAEAYQASDVVPITRFSKLMDTTAQCSDTAWETLFQEFSKPGPYRGDTNHPGWSPSEFHPPKRLLENVEFVHALVLDVDNTEDGTPVENPVTIDSMLVALAGLYGQLHTTKSHTLENPRFRVVLPFSRAVTPAEYKQVWAAANERWPGLDPSPKDPSRFWYTPSDGEHFLALPLPGEKLDPSTMRVTPPAPSLAAPAPVAPARHPEANETALDRARAYIATLPPAVSGNRGHTATFNVARKLRDLNVDKPTALTVLREYNQRCEPPWSDTDLQRKVEQGFKAKLHNPVPDRKLVRVTFGRSIDSPNEAAPAANATPQLPPRRGRSVAEVVEMWRTEGPLIHEPTGFARLDEMTGGGPVYGSRWYLNGQPNAFKTGLQLQVMHDWAKRGIVVGLLAVDEEDTDLLTRLAQRVGHSRKNCEIRSGAVLDQIQAELAELPIRFYDATWTIETAAADLAAYAAERGEKRMALAIDSLQTVNCDLDRTATRELSEMAAVTARVQAIRKVASQYRLIAMATSEMSRSAYRKADPDDLTSTMAASKHSGAVEYSARVLLGLRSVKGEGDVIEVDVAKNKHGPSGELVYLKVDRSAQSLWQADYEPPPKPNKTEARASKFAGECAAVLKCLPADPAVHMSREDLLAALADEGNSCSPNTLKTRMAQLIKDGLAHDKSDGTKQTAREYARGPKA
jgi:KaiC/GvpD/RAD55 family RecA-like ATPase